jgi:hypothetical protein
MNLEDVNLLNNFQFNTNGSIDMTQPELIGHVRDLIQAYVNSLMNSENPYILGYSVTDKKVERPDATWNPTGGSFSVYSDAAYPLRSSLNYLLETRNKPVPGSGEGIFTSNWVTRDDVQGAFVFSQELALNKVLDQLSTALSISTDSFTATDNRLFTATFNNDIKGQTTVSVSPVAGANTISIAFHVSFEKDMYDEAGSYIGYVDGWINWVSAVTFTVDSKNNTINVSVTNSQPQTYKADHPNALAEVERVLATFADFILSVFTFGQVKDLFENMVKADWSSNINANIDMAIQNIRTRIILPAGSQLFFKDCRFTDDGTMLLTTTIKD